ncbi:MAG: BBP7 family outer membrane beta-barrel protein, partial [Pirellulales bacterium]|nr:BBP7 family outer membrane beta-barrel protein [Pirellulales bacterium]
TEIQGTLADSLWYNEAENHIVGPQIGLRYFHRYKYWTFSTEGKFFGGFNSQNIYQHGQLGSELDPPGDPGEPIAMGPSSFEHKRTICEWSPGIEFRLQADWQVTRYVSLGVGWTGIWLDGIARPSNMIAYQLGTEESESDYMGILEEHNRQDVFIQGVTFRIAFNR